MFLDLIESHIAFAWVALFALVGLVALVSRVSYFHGYVSGYCDRGNIENSHRAKQLARAADLAGYQPIGAHVDGLGCPPGRK